MERKENCGGEERERKRGKREREIERERELNRMGTRV